MQNEALPGNKTDNKLLIKLLKPISTVQLKFIDESIVPNKFPNLVTCHLKFVYSCKYNIRLERRRNEYIIDGAV